jgi:N-acetylmuramoyl-L-alanine amidase
MRQALTLLLLLVCFFEVAFAGEVMRKEIEPGVMALAKDGRTVGLEVQLPRGNGAKGILSKYLKNPSEWISYKDRFNCYVPFDRLKPEYQRKVLLTVFYNDSVDENGWYHTAIFEGETLWSLCTWMAGDGAKYKQVMALSENKVDGTLKRGQRVMIPFKLLSKVMRQPTPRPVVEARPELASLTDNLVYKSDRNGPVAVYTLKKGETIYRSVVMRFTDYVDNAEVVQASNEIAERTGIKDMRDIDAGKSIYIPVAMLSDKYQPRGTASRLAYEESLEESARLKKATVPSKGLAGVVVILDPGHGGMDVGSEHRASGLYEDEINYDIVMRIKSILEKETDARVHMTMIDRSTGHVSNDRNRFSQDEDEELLTHPRYRNDVSTKVSANLRWMMVNSIYDTELKRGVTSRNVVFTSIHTDSISNSAHRGTMIYIPGAKYRKSKYSGNSAVYSKYTEGRSFKHYASTSSERRTDEALSRNFANLVMEELGKHRIKRHDGGNSIRLKIQRTKTNSYVPAVIHYSKVPTKILIETANLQNAQDRQRLADPWWREQYAKAYVAALKRNFNASSGTSLALAD